MKDLHLLVWLTQLGLSIALPLAGFLFLALWLKNSCGWGDWVLWAGILLGIISAVDGLRYSLKAMSRFTGERRSREEEPPVSFNDHD